jgi:hypothetical protein
MKNVKYICTIKDKLKEEFRHLVEIDGKNVVFVFDCKDSLQMIRYKDIYAFADLKKPNEFKEIIKSKGFSDLNLGLYEYFDLSKFDNSYYLNLYNMKLEFDKVYNKFNKVLNVINDEVKENDTVLMFRK